MRVGMMMRDTEYRDALIEMMADMDKDVFIEIAGPGSIRKDAVILTDILPSEIESRSLSRIKERTLFLSPVPVDRSKLRPVFKDSEDRNDGNNRKYIQENMPESGCRLIFKYSSLISIMSELSLIYSAWSGDTGTITPATRVIAVTGDADQLSAVRCRTLARQIAYRHGGSILVLPLGYINDYRTDAEGDSGGWFRKLMYFIDEGRDYPPEGFTLTDSYGISCLKLPGGINPLTSLGRGHLSDLITSMSRHFDTLILDIGTCYSDTNLSILRKADNILFFGSGRRIADPDDFTGKKYSENLTQITCHDTGTEAREIDDFISETYGRADEKKNDTEIQERNR
ncbi:MAG: hypothetical protein IJY32_02745 [Mogibacterium sp.]|nr:hypothetical protein [Mogibacterium sp.]